MRRSFFISLCVSALVSQAQGETETTALWLFDERGQPIPGYSVQDCIYVNGDAVEYEVEWLKKGKDVSSLVGKTVQLVFELHGAKLYAMQFEQTSNLGGTTFPPSALNAR